MNKKQMEGRIERLEEDVKRLWKRLDILENPPFEPRTFDFPRDKLEKLLDLYDKSKQSGKITDHLRLWHFIEEALPVTQNGAWKIVVGNKVYVEETNQ